MMVTSWQPFGPFCGHYWHLSAALGTLWVTLGVTLGALAASGGAFGVTFGISLGSVWVSVGDFGSVDGSFATISSHSGYMKLHFQKTSIFLTDFNEFI